MSKEHTNLPCLIDPKRQCANKCGWVSQNAADLNSWGTNRAVRGFIQRQGYDRVSPGLIKQLLVNPKGGFNTEAFNDILPFSPDMWGLREKIAYARFNIIRFGEDPTDIQCSVLKEMIEQSGWTADKFLRYLKENF